MNPTSTHQKATDSSNLTPWNPGHTKIDNVQDLLAHAENYRLDYNTVRPHEALAWNRPADVHRGLADPTVPSFHQPLSLPTT